MNGRETQDQSLAQPLTPREEEILNCLGDEMSNRQIAEHLVVSLNTVKWYVRQIYNKLGVDNRKAAVARARSLGLLAAEEQEGEIRHNLPIAATPFVGREDELAVLAEFIADPQVRIITITGPGGIGKTRLALEAAGCELVPESQYPDGVFFVSLAPLNSAEEIVSALASALDFYFQGSGNETEQLLSYLRQKQMLFVMDNFEHILEGRAFLAQINEQAAEITLIVTSRERLQLRGEQLFPLHGLEMSHTADSLKESPAEQLFLHIAKRTTPDFRLLEGDAEQVMRICGLVDGMPLGLELAASWVGLLPLTDIADEIEQNLGLLTTEHHDVPVRHQSMEAALDVSWRRLTSEQQHAFQELTVFRGGFTRTAALEVAGATLPMLVTLANKSWLAYDRQNDRYHIHELLRQYGAGKLSTESAHEQEVRERHSAFFCTYLQERETDWFGPRQKEAAAEVRDEIDNIQRAWYRAVKQGDVNLLSQSLNSLCRFYLWEGRMTDGQHACRSAADGLSKSLAEQGSDDPERMAVWSRVLAWQSKFVGEVTQKEELLSLSQQILDRIAPTGWDTRAKQASIFLAKASVARKRDYEETIHFGNLGLEIYRDLGDRWGEAEALGLLGGGYLFQGAFDRADNLLRESLEIRRELEDRKGIAETIEDLGLIAQHKGALDEAETLHQQSSMLFKQLGNRFREGLSLNVLSFTLSWVGKFSAANEAAARSSELHRDLGQYPNPWNLIASTIAAIHLGRYSGARAIASEALEISRQRGHKAETGFALMHLGTVSFVEGDLTKANSFLLESASVLAALKHVNQALPLAILSYVLRAQGESELAHSYLANTLRSGIKLRSIRPIKYSLPAAALIAADDGFTQRAIETYGLAQRFGHIRNSCWFADVACNELDEVRTSLPADVAAAAEARGREMDVWETAAALLRELDGR